MESFNNYCRETFGLDLIIGISDICLDFSNIMPAYHNSLKILQNVVASGVYYKKNEGSLIVDTHQSKLQKIY